MDPPRGHQRLIGATAGIMATPPYPFSTFPCQPKPNISNKIESRQTKKCSNLKYP